MTMEEELSRLRARVEDLEDETPNLAEQNQQLDDDNQIIVMSVVAAQAAAQATAQAHSAELSREDAR